MPRVHSGHAFSQDKFAIAVGELEDDDPSTMLLIYDETFEGLWGAVELPRIVLSVHSMPSENHGRPIYVAMSDEGDVYFIEGDVPVEKIPGAGVRSEDAQGYGPMNMIRCVGDTLYACGLNGQVYRRPKGGPWERLAAVGMSGMDEAHLSAVAAHPDGTVCTVGFGEQLYRTPTPSEQAELDAARKAGDRALRRELRARYRPMLAPPGPRAYLSGAEGWRRVELDSNGKLEDVAAEAEEAFLAVGSMGFAVVFDDPETAKDLAFDDSPRHLHAVRTHDGKSYVLADREIRVLDAAHSLNESIPLPDELTRPHQIDVVEGALWLFDHAGVARYTDGSWQRIEIPEVLWKRAT